MLALSSQDDSSSVPYWQVQQRRNSMNHVTTCLPRYALLAVTLLFTALAGDSGLAAGAGPPADATLRVRTAPNG